MSEVQSRVEDLNGSPAAPRPANGTNPIRLILLLLVFGVALACLLYDYTIARPNIQKADQTIQGLMEGSIKDPNGDGTVTADEVQLILGNKPSRIDQLPNGMIEVYSWRSGLPFRTYSLYVVYSGKQMPLLHSATTNTQPEGDQLPAVTIVPRKMSKEQIKGFEPPGIIGPPVGSDAKKGPRAAKTESSVPEALDDPTPEQPPADAPAADEPAPEQPPADAPAPAPTQEQPPADAPAADEPTQEQPPADEPAPDEPTQEQSPADEPAPADPTPEQPPADAPASDEPTQEQPPADGE
ncbi:MAG: hypothetical protein ACYC0X_10140 [Pirellulaceae bacterium]